LEIPYRNPCTSNQIDHNCLNQHMHNIIQHNTLPAKVQNDNIPGENIILGEVLVEGEFEAVYEGLYDSPFGKLEEK
jgi:hypothetical protein